MANNGARAAPFADEELTASLLASAPWSAARDLPDVVGWVDLVTFPLEVLPILRSRLHTIPRPGATQQFPIPKEGSDDQRTVTISDPYDELIYRCLTGRVVAAIDASLGNEVKSYRLSLPPPGWRLRNYRYGNDERRADGIRFIESGMFGAFGVMDVRKYYPSISVSRLAAGLERLGALPANVAALAVYLESWAEVWGVSGLPIGFESSGVLGNAMLIPLDSVLRASGVRFSRYTDDLHLYLEDRNVWAAARNLVAAALNELGLEANDKKTKCVLTQAVARRVAGHDPMLAALSAGLTQRDASALLQVKDMFDRESVPAHPNGRRLRFALGVFERFGDDHALRVLIDRPALFSFGAASWGRYLSRLRRDNKCDQDWLVGVASAASTKESACLQFHALRALGVAGHVSQSAGVSLRDLATDPSRSWGPVKAAAADAWARADGWKVGNAVDAALAAGDVSQQRALALSLRHGDENKQRRTGLRKLHTIQVCRPAVAWIEAGCPAAA